MGNSDYSGYLHERPLFALGEKRAAAAPSKKLPRSLSFEKIVELSQRCHHEAQRLLIHGAYDTGIRASEIPLITKADLPDINRFPPDWNYFGLHVKGSKARGRNFKERKTIISRVLLIRLSRHHRTKAYRSKYRGDDTLAPAFTNVYGDPWTEDAIESVFRRAKARTEIEKAHVHMLRHGFALSVMGSKHGRDAVENLIIANQTLGHENLSTTQVYTRMRMEALSQLINAMGTAEYENRFEQLQELFDSTFLPERKNPVPQRFGRQS